MRNLSYTLIIPIATAIIANAAGADEFAPGTTGAYQESIVAFFGRQCMECHDEATAKAGLNLEKLSSS